MTLPVITPLPPAPARSDAPNDFSAKADAFAAALPGLVSEINGAAEYIEQRAAEAEQSAQSALNAVAVAGSAEGIPALTGNAGKVLRINAEENAVLWEDAAPPASTAIPGLIELATSQEGIAGTDTSRAIVPAVLKMVLNAVLDSFAKLSSPALAGTPTAPTAAPWTKTKQIATTEFVDQCANTVSGYNLISDPTFFSGARTNHPEAVVHSRGDGVVPDGCPTARALQLALTAGSGNIYMNFFVSESGRPPELSNAAMIAAVPGEVFDCECWVYTTANRNQIGIWGQFYTLDGTSIGHGWAVSGGDGVIITNTVGQWVKLTGLVTVPETAVTSSMAVRVSGGDAADIWFSAPVFRRRSAQLAALDANKQPLAANLTALAALVGAANKVPYFTGEGAMALADVTAFAMTLAAAQDKLEARTALGACGITDPSTYALSGTAVDISGVPSWVKRITIVIEDFSLSGSQYPALQLGTTAGVITTGYSGSCSSSAGSGGGTAVSMSTYVPLTILNGAGNAFNAGVTLRRGSGNKWSIEVHSGMTNTALTNTAVGSVELGGALDTIRLTSSNGIDTIDSGSATFMYEG